MELIEKQGYKQTELGWIPEDWSTNKLTEVVEYIHGKAHEQDIDENGQYIVANSKFISTDGLIKKFSKKIHCEAKKGDVLTVLSDIPNGKALAKCFYVESDNEITVNQRICIWRSKNSHPKFNFYKLNRLPYFLAINDGVNQTNIGNSDIEKCIVVMPSLKEQKAIATALSDVDELITNLDQLITKKKAIKQGAMQQLLTPPHKGGKRLEGYTGEWVEKVLGRIGNTFGGLSGKTKTDFENGKYPYITFLNVMNNTIIDSTIFEYVNIKSGEQQNKARKGDLFFNTSSETPEEVGMCAILKEEVKDLYLNSFCFGFRLKEDSDIDGLLFSYLINSPIGRNLFLSLAQGATRYNLSKSNFNKLIIEVPPLKEQKAIAQILFDIDEEIKKLESKKSKCQSVKQGMMQELLTGKTRLI